MSTAHDTGVEAGRQIRLTPVPPGFWPVVIGGALMVLGPLFGFLFGSMLGVDEMVGSVRAIYASLLVGFVVAGIGLVSILFGARRLIVDQHARSRAADQQD